MNNVAVIGSQWGDEGKGKIVDWLSSEADIVVRFQGGHNAGHTLVINGVTYTVVDLVSISQEIANANYNLCTTLVTDMRFIFKNNSSFNSDIGFWDTSNTIVMEQMFNDASAFNQDISSWDTSKTTRMYGMFENAAVFNQDLTGWCMSNIASEPTNFASNSALTNTNKPVWGTCP